MGELLLHPGGASMRAVRPRQRQKSSSGESQENAHLSESLSMPLLTRTATIPQSDDKLRDILKKWKQKKWLSKRGRQCCIAFSDSERTELLDYFMTWTDGEELLTLETLKHMLTALNLARSEADLQRLTGDEDLYFDDFLALIKSH